MIVMKFGGTSLVSAAAIRTVCRIIRARLEAHPVVVVSAHAGVTDSLEQLAAAAVEGRADSRALREQHEGILRDLDLDPRVHGKLLDELGDLCRGISLVGELSPRSRDYVLSFGERLSARTVAAALRATGIEASAIDAFDLGIRTDSDFGKARLLPDDGRIATNLAGVRGTAVVTGFIGKDTRGNISTLGRNGSDLTAAFLGNVLEAEEIQIWTDVDGVLTADPKIVDGARPIPRMSYDEAAELANAGGKVLHPASLQPAIEKEIPVRVLNTHRPDSTGTLIVPSFEDPEAVVRCIAHKRRVTLVNIESSRMLAQPGFLKRIFAVFERHGMSVDMVSTSEISVSITLDNTQGLVQAVRELSEFSRVEVEENLGSVCVVGHGMRQRLGVPARVFGPLREASVAVRMISQGALKVNVSLVVPGPELDTTVRALHAEFFGS